MVSCHEFSVFINVMLSFFSSVFIYIGNLLDLVALPLPAHKEVFLNIALDLESLEPETVQGGG